MPKLFTLCALLITLSTASFAQSTTSRTSDAVSEVTKPSSDFVMLQFTYEGWSKVPDSIHTTGIGRGFNAYLCYDFPIKKSHLSFAAGIGIGTSNIYLDNQEISFHDTGALGNAVRFIPETKDYKKYKLTTAYLEAPFELRYFANNKNRNKGFKAAIGLRVGTLVGAHTKDRISVDGTRYIEKSASKRYLDSWRFSGTLRVGYGNFSLFGSYNINTLFKDGSGPGIVPYSIGLCVTGL